MSYIKLFEDFKQNNITQDDIIKCIDNGGVIYATIVRNYPDNNPDLPLNPLSIDEDGTITVEFDGKNFEVDIKYVDRIEWRNINEAIYLSDSISQYINYIQSIKNDKIAKLINIIRSDNSHYETDETLNYLGLASEPNMISYIPTNRRAGKNREDLFLDGRRTSIRIGRAIKKVIELIKPNLQFEGKIDSKIFSIREKNYTNIEGEAERVENFYKCIIPSSSGIYRFINLGDCLIKIKSSEFELVGKLVDIRNEWRGYGLLINANQPNFRFSSCDNAYSQIREEIGTIYPVEIEISNKPITDSDVEKFVNEYISIVKMNSSDESSKIEEVSGEEIVKWYDEKNYQSDFGKLGSSCMRHSDCSSYFNIYVEVAKLIILTNKDNKLLGRALLWKLDDGRMFMDRVYTISVTDDNIFFNYAIEKGYIYRTTSVKYTYMMGGKEIDPGIMKVHVGIIFENYPYVDTLKYYLNESTLCNHNIGYYITLQDTDGRWLEYYEGDDD